MPRRIPETQIALVYILIDNYYGKNFTKIDKWEVSSSLIFLQIKRLRDKRKSREGEPFGQCIKINYDMSHMPALAFFVSGSD